MEYDFHYLIYRYTLPGAREKFEDICTRLLQKIHGSEAHRIAVSRGDGGIDVMVGDMSKPFHIFQCKYFPNGIGTSQQKQINESFEKASALNIDRWTLCLGFDLTKEAMAWWSDWKKNAQERTKITIDLCAGTYLLNQLRDYGLYEEVFDSTGAHELQEVLDSCKTLLSSGLLSGMTSGHEAAEILSPELIAQAQCECTSKDVRKYYIVDNSFQTMLRVISAGMDVANPEAEEAIIQGLSDDRPVILAGNGGMGKTSLMLRCAIRWVRSGSPAVWLSLSDRREMTAQEAKSLCRALQNSIADDQRLLLCIDDPFEGQKALDHLRRAIVGMDGIRLLLAERSNRLSILANRNKNSLARWFDGALVVALEGQKADSVFRLNSYEVIPFHETTNRREAILRRSLDCLESEKIIPAESGDAILHRTIQRYALPNVSLVELIYRTLFLAQKDADKPEEIRLDWDEWTYFLRKKLNLDDDARWLYGPIAACSVFGIPMTVPLFCQILDRRPNELHRALRDWKIKGHAEPIRYLEKGERLRPKHAVAAELFFLFHAGKEDRNYNTGEVITDVMLETIDSMDEWEINDFLQLLVINKQMLKYGKWGRFTGINHWDLLNRILRRHKDREICLEAEPLATALLGLIWAIPADRNAKEKKLTLDYLSQYAPSMYADLTLAKLYTEWGKLLAEMKQDKLAEEKLRAVADTMPRQLHARTELGKLLAKQRGREAEAERFLREAIFIDPKNIHPHTELGRLLAKQPGREAEAEQFLKEAIRIDPKNLHPHTELGRLLAKQPGRETEAEQFLREAMQIDRKHIQSRTELSRLLAKQHGRETEAEQFLREAMQIDRKDIQSRTELGRLLAKQPGREAESERFLTEILSIDPRNLHARTVLADLCIRQNRLVEAEQFYREVLKINPGNRFALNGLKKLGKQP